MRFIKVLLFCVSYVSAELPHYIKPCARNDPGFNDCAIKHANENIKELVKGDPEHGIPVLDPLYIKEFTVFANGLRIINKDTEVRGYKNLVVTHANYDIKNKKYNVIITLPRLELSGKYEINGKILILPITGKGTVNCIFLNTEIDVKGAIALETINGTNYLQTINPEIVMKPQRMYLRFGNLFNGNKLLEKQMNEFLDENWKDVYNEISKPGIDATISTFIDIINKIQRIAPYDEMFPETIP